MATRKAKWQNDYIAKAYDRINLTVPKGQKEAIQEAAKQTDLSHQGAELYDRSKCVDRSIGRFIRL